MKFGNKSKFGTKLNREGSKRVEEMCACCGELPAPGQEVTRVLPDIPSNLCGPCRRAGCDGIEPCHLPAEFWERSRYFRAIQFAWMEAHALEERWLKGELPSE